MADLKVTQTRSAIGSKPKQRGTLRALPNPELEDAQAVCVVQHETFQRCGKSSCWRPITAKHCGNIAKRDRS